MKALIQRVSQASVTIEGVEKGAITQGLVVFLGIEKTDTPAIAQKLLNRLIDYRIFSDQEGKMNLSLRDIHGGLLIISQFTLAAETRKGLRPSFSSAAPPEPAKNLYTFFVEQAQQQLDQVAQGEFAADMQVQLINDGPVTFLLEA
ncbi:D-aminoacyl-tRNA deacylase [Marinospirillum sp. MEB164]|uniref:D-aminoacyl-tRNA deacylase n=1 Tax=Marinospirillum alkalitolerans TaxID=3123374 RepID=A0ABW8PVB6_9GAMM